MYFKSNTLQVPSTSFCTQTVQLKKISVTKQFTNTSRPCCMPLAVFLRNCAYRKNDILIRKRDLSGNKPWCTVVLYLNK